MRDYQTCISTKDVFFFFWFFNLLSWIWVNWANAWIKYYTHYNNGLFNNGINNQTRDTGKTHMLNARESGRVTQCAPVTHARV